MRQLLYWFIVTSHGQRTCHNMPTAYCICIYAIKQTNYCRIDFRTQNETYSTWNLISSLRQRSLMTREKGEERKRPLPASDAIVIIVICLPTK